LQGSSATCEQLLKAEKRKCLELSKLMEALKREHEQELEKAVKDSHNSHIKVYMYNVYL